MRCVLTVIAWCSRVGTLADADAANNNKRSGGSAMLGEARMARSFFGTDLNRIFTRAPVLLLVNRSTYRIIFGVDATHACQVAGRSTRLFKFKIYIKI